MVTVIETVVNVLLHIFILFLILSTIFWSVISKVEKKSITDELNNNINSYFDNSDLSTKDALKEFATSNKDSLDFLEKLYSKPDETTQISNSWLFQTNILYIIILLVIIVTIVLVIRFVCNIKDFPLLYILRENIVIFMFVGLVEVWFFLNIGMKFIPTKPSSIITNVKNDLIETL